jgi:hypothetical protein
VGIRLGVHVPSPFRSFIIVLGALPLRRSIAARQTRIYSQLILSYLHRYDHRLNGCVKDFIKRRRGKPVD